MKTLSRPSQSNQAIHRCYAGPVRRLGGQQSLKITVDAISHDLHGDIKFKLNSRRLLLRSLLQTCGRGSFGVKSVAIRGCLSRCVLSQLAFL